MPLRISYCQYRLLFKRPFGTAHGLRDGTDAVFVRVEESGYVGYGEITLPPYLEETTRDAISRLSSIATRTTWGADALYLALDKLPEFEHGGSGCRGGLSTALIDFLGRRRQTTARELLGVKSTGDPVTLMTVGISPVEELKSRLEELVPSGGLKVKVGDPEAKARIKVLMDLDDRKLFLDANQGLQAVDEVVELVSVVGSGRLIGLEQPFASEMDQSNQRLKDLDMVVFADESIWSMEDLKTKSELFSGVNLKLMKNGGLDQARDMAQAAEALGLAVMLGSMSESSLGCTAMAQLAGLAGIVDLDGPWLIKNDPFSGIGMSEGRLVLPNGPGIGAALKAALPFETFGT